MKVLIKYPFAFKYIHAGVTPAPALSRVDVLPIQLGLGCSLSGGCATFLFRLKALLICFSLGMSISAPGRGPSSSSSTPPAGLRSGNGSWAPPRTELSVRFRPPPSLLVFGALVGWGGLAGVASDITVLPPAGAAVGLSEVPLAVEVRGGGLLRASVRRRCCLAALPTSFLAAGTVATPPADVVSGSSSSEEESVEESDDESLDDCS